MILIYKQYFDVIFNKEKPKHELFLFINSSNICKYSKELFLICIGSNELICSFVSTGVCLSRKNETNDRGFFLFDTTVESSDVFIKKKEIKYFKTKNEIVKHLFILFFN